jgi:hypothetical protein
MEIQDTMVSNVGCEYIIGFFWLQQKLGW